MTLKAAAQYLTGTVLAVDPGKREITGLAVPYGEPTERMHGPSGARYQAFEKGSAKLRDSSKLYYGHDHLALGTPVGRVVSGEHLDEGLKIAARFARTPKGDEVYELSKPDLDDGKAVLDSFSIGFFDVAGRFDEETDTYWHTEIDVFETSVVPDPQYATARVQTVLSTHHQEGSKMTPEQIARLKALRAMTQLSNTEGNELASLAILERQQTSEDGVTRSELTALSGSIEQLDRRLATLGDRHGDPAPSIPFRSYGEFLKACAKGETTAVEFLSLVSASANLEDDSLSTLAYAGGTVSDAGDWVKDSWVGDIYRPLTERRRVLNSFTTRPLPATGMNVEYGKLLSDTVDVQQQVNEGDVLAYGKLAFTTATAPVLTYGGWGEMSRQEIERTAMQVVEKFFAALTNRYAKVTESAVRAAAVNPANSTELPGAANTLASADDWIDFVVDGAFALEDANLAPEFLLVGRDRFKALAKLRDGAATDAPRLLDRNSGSVNIVGLSGRVFDLPVIPVLDPGVVRLCDSSAIATFEAGGAPFRLQDDDITNLTKAMSIYGYVSVAVEDPAGIVRPNDGV